MRKGVEEPNVLYIPIAPGILETEQQLDWIKQQVRDGIVHALVLETDLAGRVPADDPYNLLGSIPELSQQVPTFLVIQAPGQQRYPRKDQSSETAGGTVLQTAYSAMAEEVITKIRSVLRQTRDRNEVTQVVKELFRKKDAV